jgi:ferritin-like metal-binding protein YciE
VRAARNRRSLYGTSRRNKSLETGVERKHPEATGETTMPAKQKTLQDLFLIGLKDIYHAEKALLRSLRKMAKAAESDQLRQAFETHRAETEGQVDRLERVFEMVGKRPQGKTCEAMQGILAEGEEVMDDFAESEALDAGLLAAAQAVEHYEIARYGTLRSWAAQLGMNDAVTLLEETLQEEKKTDQLLTQLAESALNQKAA